MDYIRSKRWVQEIGKTDQFFKLKEETTPLFTKQGFASSYISSSIWDDIKIQQFAEKISPSYGVQDFITNTLKTPTYDKLLLQERQAGLLYFANSRLQSLLTPYVEQRWDWLLTLDPKIKNFVMDNMFPKKIMSRWLYAHPQLLNIYHLYRAYWSPFMHTIYPLSILLGPYMYIRNKLKMKIAFKAYTKAIYQTIQWLYRSSTTTVAKLRNIIVLIIYIGIYFYNFIQIIDWSYQIRKYKHMLTNHMKHIQRTTLRFQRIVKRIKIDFWKPYLPHITREMLLIPQKLTTYTFHRLWKYPSTRESLQHIFQTLIVYEGLRNMSGLLRKDWSLCSYKYPVTFMGQMKHPELDEPVANPICLYNNLIITGPNAAGKTTYVKTFLWNIIVGQSFGMIRASYGNIKLYDAILHHDRIKDTVGSSSLFEAEMYKVKEVLETTNQYQNSIYFMDEPFHSTPPVDGSSMLKALMVYLATSKSIKMILTTHYFTLQELVKEEPTLFKNICMTAETKEDEYQFSYNIQKGYSRQSIGIELLKQNDFPMELIHNAIKMKNKLYSLKVNAP